MYKTFNQSTQLLHQIYHKNCLFFSKIATLFRITVDMMYIYDKIMQQYVAIIITIISILTSKRAHIQH